MTYVYLALGVLVGVILTVQVVGMRLPVGHRAIVSKGLSASPERVWKALTDIENHPTWRKELISIQKTNDSPLAWVEKSRFGEMPLQVEVFEPNQRLVARIDGRKLPFGGTWTFELEPEDGETKLTITEDGEIYSPMFRFLSRYVFGYAKTIEGYLDQLDDHLAKEKKSHGA